NGEDGYREEAPVGWFPAHGDVQSDVARNVGGGAAIEDTSNGRTAMNILWWALFGLIAGALAKFVMPGKGPGGIIMTILLGIGGAMGGGLIGSHLGFGDIDGFDLRSMLLAVGGGVLVLFLYGLATRARA